MAPAHTTASHGPRPSTPPWLPGSFLPPFPVELLPARLSTRCLWVPLALVMIPRPPPAGRRGRTCDARAPASTSANHPPASDRCVPHRRPPPPPRLPARFPPRPNFSLACLPACGFMSVLVPWQLRSFLFLVAAALLFDHNLRGRLSTAASRVSHRGRSAPPRATTKQRGKRGCPGGLFLYGGQGGSLVPPHTRWRVFLSAFHLPRKAMAVL